MATAWNLKKVHSILDQKIKVDLNNIYRDLTNLNNNIELLADVDQTATAKNGEMIANFSGHKAVKYFTTLKANGGYYMKSEDFYTKAYKLCAQLVEKGQQRAVKDNNSKYKSYSKWSSTLPTNKKFTFQHAMYDRINEDVTNVSGNILTLKENVDSSYDKYISDIRRFSTDLKELKKYTPDEVDRNIAKICTKIETIATNTQKRQRQLSDYVYQVTLECIMDKINAAQAMDTVNTFDDSSATRTID